MNTLNQFEQKIFDFLQVRSTPIGGSLKMNPAQFLLEYGWLYEPRALPSEYQMGTPKECYANAFRLMFADDNLTYCEGYVLTNTGVKIQHAWAADKSGGIFENTLVQPGLAYLGVPFDTHYAVIHRTLYNPVATIIDNWQNGYPLLREDCDSPKKWVAKGGTGRRRAMVCQQ